MLHPEEWSKMVSASVVPVVIISSCGLLGLAFYNRMATIVSRLRQFQQERITEQEAYARHRITDAADPVAAIRHRHVLDILDEQTRQVMYRARLVQQTILCLLITIGCLTVCSMATGLSMIWPRAMHLAVFLFFSGMTVLLIGTILAIMEMRASLSPLSHEREMVEKMGQELESLFNDKS